MSELERENKRLRAVVEGLKSTVESMRLYLIESLDPEQLPFIEKEIAELREKAEALDMLEEMNEVNLLRFGNKFFVSSYRMFSNVKQPYKASDDNLSAAIRAAYHAWKEVKE